MRSKFLRAWLLATGLFLLVGCSALRLAYDHGPMLAWWWLDGWGDFGGEQALRVKDGIRSWFDWHRKAELDGYAAWLGRVQAKSAESVTPAQMCAWADEARQQLEPALQQAIITLAPWVAGLSEGQLQHIARRYAEDNEELRREHLQPDAAERQAAALQRLQDRAERFYGRLSGAQRELLSRMLRASPMDARRWLAEREQRQQQTLRALRRLLAERADAPRAAAVLRGLVADVERSPDPAYRAHQQRVRAFNCELAARLHDSASTAQRRVLHDRLQGWRDDLAVLAASSRAHPP
ncbi:MAG: hypothetical protein ABS84_03765 [Rubrivivax sp. SCN 71-131]|jgi:hypothetical protein|nr:MAG: hypothetical protein ABS84_03765 [Rubrivivax sp. SCN 71-131]